jgi:hypothetical protein
MTSTPVDDLATLAPAVWNLLGDYARAVDSRDAVRVGELFGGDGTLAPPGNEITGADALAAFSLGAPGGTHVQGVPTIARDADGTVLATSSFVFVNSSTYGVTAGEYRDRIREAPDGLVFVRRDITIRVRTSDPKPEQ